jgi:SAM-dependent methyltransferase
MHSNEEQNTAKSVTLPRESLARFFQSQLDADLAGHVNEIEVNADSENLEALFAVLARQWDSLGKQKPHYSVLSSDEYLPARLNLETLDRFYSTGSGEVSLLDRLIRKNGVEYPENVVCMELGCGVGRVTVHLAQRFPVVQAIDVSIGNLVECKAELARRNISNVKLFHLTHPGALTNIPRFNVFFSRIVLQHNPPPVQLFIIKTVLDGLDDGGLALFQTVTSGIGYKYSIAAHLAAHPETDFEMHALPMRHILNEIRSARCVLVDVIRDLAAGFNVASYTFLIKKELK